MKHFGMMVAVANKFTIVDNGYVQSKAEAFRAATALLAAETDSARRY